jgi:hypothetical protein
MPGVRRATDRGAPERPSGPPHCERALEGALGREHAFVMQDHEGMHHDGPDVQRQERPSSFAPSLVSPHAQEPAPRARPWIDAVGDPARCGHGPARVVSNKRLDAFLAHGFLRVRCDGFSVRAPPSAVPQGPGGMSELRRKPASCLLPWASAGTPQQAGPPRRRFSADLCPSARRARGLVPHLGVSADSCGSKSGVATCKNALPARSAPSPAAPETEASL